MGGGEGEIVWIIIGGGIVGRSGDGEAVVWWLNTWLGSLERAITKERLYELRNMRNGLGARKMRRMV
jgi:hypothetical protein